MPELKKYLNKRVTNYLITACIIIGFISFGAIIAFTWRSINIKSLGSEVLGVLTLSAALLVSYIGKRIFTKL